MTAVKDRHLHSLLNPAILVTSILLGVTGCSNSDLSAITHQVSTLGSSMMPSTASSDSVKSPEWGEVS